MKESTFETLKKIENGYFSMTEFTKEQINFIKRLVIIAYDNGIADAKDKLSKLIEDFNYKVKTNG